MKTFFVLLVLFAVSLPAFSQQSSQSANDDKYIISVMEKALSSKWYEKLKIKGYAHFRYNRFLETNNKMTNTGMDRSLGDKQGFFIRRARLAIYGEVTEKIFIHVQADYATAVGESQNFFQARDAYFDYALDSNKEFRIRTGQSKVPYGFETLQSSSLRAAIDRADAIDMGVPNEYDLGVYFMYAPTEIRKRFKELAVPELKGSGDYGMFAMGVYNGQTMNKPEKNNDLHRVARVTYPFKLSNGQFIETSVSAYEGKFNIQGKDYYDQRTAAALVVYPQPIGFQAEYNVGQGPQYDKDSDDVQVERLYGGYLQVNYSTYYKDHRFFPYVRFQEYHGGKKLEDGRYNVYNEWEFGTEWQPNTNLKLTIAYDIGDRFTQNKTAFNNASFPAAANHVKGNALRLQAQVNY